MGQLVWAPTAAADLRAIARYVGVQERRPITADRLVDEIVKKCDLYSQNPELGAIWPADLRFRTLRYKRWLVFYRQLADSAGIEVLRVVDAARDIPKLLTDL
jgi:plasmid stabilization system protein ParE